MFRTILVLRLAYSERLISSDKTAFIRSSKLAVIFILQEFIFTLQGIVGYRRQDTWRLFLFCTVVPGIFNHGLHEAGRDTSTKCHTATRGPRSRGLGQKSLTDFLHLKRSLVNEASGETKDL